MSGVDCCVCDDNLISKFVCVLIPQIAWEGMREVDCDNGWIRSLALFVDLLDSKNE